MLGLGLGLTKIMICFGLKFGLGLELKKIIFFGLGLDLGLGLKRIIFFD